MSVVGFRSIVVVVLCGCFLKGEVWGFGCVGGWSGGISAVMGAGVHLGEYSERWVGDVGGWECVEGG